MITNSMKRPTRVLYLLPLLLNDVRSSYLRDRNTSATNDVSKRGNGGWPRRRNPVNDGASSDAPLSSIRRALPQNQETYEYYKCSPNIVEFESVVFIEFNSDLSNLTDSERQSLEQGFLSTYNTLNQAHCDLSFHRSILDVTLEWPPRRRLKKTKENKKDSFTIVVDGFNTTGPDFYPNNSQNQSALENYQIDVDGEVIEEEPQKQYVDIARFYVNVECHNCPTNTSLFSSNDVIPPSSIHSTVASIAQGRATGSATEEMESCACLVDKKFDAPFRAPTASEFQVQFNQTVGDLHVNGVLHDLDEVEDLVEVDVVDCSSNKKKFSSSIIVDLEGSVELLTREERHALEQGYVHIARGLNVFFVIPPP